MPRGASYASIKANPNSNLNKARRAKRAAARKFNRYSKTIAPIVNRLIRRTEEKKFAGLVIENGVAHNAAIGTGDEYPILPAITQGQAYNQRIGNRMNPVSLIVNGAVTFNDYGEGFVGVPLRVVVMVLQAKQIRDTTLLPTPNINQLLDNGTGGVAWDGSTVNSFYPVNTEEFTVLAKRTFKLSDITQENAKCMSRRYRLKVRCPKQFLYEGAGNYPTNFAPFIVLGWARDDAVTPMVTDVWVKHTCSSRLTYTDS